MARPVIVKDVKDRIKANKETLKVTKKALNDGMTSLVKGEDVDKFAVRAALAMFIKAAGAITKDTELLATVSK